MKYYVCYLVLAPSVRIAMREFDDEAQALNWGKQLPSYVIFQARSLIILGILP